MPGVDIKKDDHVRVMNGKSRGHEGRVIRVLPREGRVMVEGAAMAKKHQRTQGKRSTSGRNKARASSLLSRSRPACARSRVRRGFSSER